MQEAKKQAENDAVRGDNKVDKVVRTEAEWRSVLSEEAYRITREGGTERAFTGKYNMEKRDGLYTCVGCGATLFDATNKYDSGSGWPSFDEVVSSNAITLKQDRSHGMVRVEVVCSRCDAHLGHLFDDGPKETTGKRYCINSAALVLKDRKGSGLGDEPTTQ